MNLPRSTITGLGYLLLALISAPRDSLGDLYEDLLSDDILIFKQAAERASETPTPAAVRRLMAVILSNEPRFRTAQTFGDQIVREPCTYALLALSRIVPNPPTTFTSDYTRQNGPGPYVHYLELWESWWEENGIHYGDDATEFPPRDEQSLLNLDREGREAIEQEHYEKSVRLIARLTSRHIDKPKSTFDTIIEEYLGERRSARAAARVAASTPVVVAAPLDPTHGVPVKTQADDSAEPVQSGNQSRWHWIAVTGIIAVSAITGFLFKRQGRINRGNR